MLLQLELSQCLNQDVSEFSPYPSFYNNPFVQRTDKVRINNLLYFIIILHKEQYLSTGLLGNSIKITASLTLLN